MSRVPIRIRRGLRIPLAGVPATDVVDSLASPTVAVLPSSFRGLKPRLMVREGDSVRRGQPLFSDKRNDKLRFASPAGGVVREIRYGPRRVVEAIVVEVASREEIEHGQEFSPSRMATMSRDEALAPLLGTGLLSLLVQRPFSRIPDPATVPKAIFVNAMNSAPFLPDADVAVRGSEAEFQAGLDVLARLTPGRVHLCLPHGRALGQALVGARNVESHFFDGPHPSGNASVHIHHIDPIRPGDVVWTIRALDVVLVGHLFLTGTHPASRIISLGGPGVAGPAARHYRVRIGGELGPVIHGRLADGELRVVAGDVLSGRKVAPDGWMGLSDVALTVVPEGRARRFLGWLAPGLSDFSHSRTFLSRWIGDRGRTWALDTNLHGGYRAMVATGLYDRFVPMRIMTDFLVRAVLAHDTDEAVKLGLLEVDPEDFALPAFACPSKMDLVGIIRSGLDELEAEGL